MCAEHRFISNVLNCILISEATFHTLQILIREKQFFILFRFVNKVKICYFFRFLFEVDKFTVSSYTLCLNLSGKKENFWIMLWTRIKFVLSTSVSHCCLSWLDWFKKPKQISQNRISVWPCATLNFMNKCNDRKSKSNIKKEKKKNNSKCKYKKNNNLYYQQNASVRLIETRDTQKQNKQI